jgi:hypothetical protein
MKKVALIIGLFVVGFVVDVNAQCTQGNCHNGNGTFKFDNGDIYKGQWQEGKPHGSGLYEFSDGDVYKGESQAGAFSGDGTYTWKDKTRYDGNFKEGKREGFGKFTWVNGDTYYGHWAADVIVDTEVKLSKEIQKKPTIAN